MRNKKSRLRSAMEGTAFFFIGTVLLDWTHISHEPSHLDQVVSIALWLVAAIGFGFTFDSVFRFLWPKLSRWYQEHR
jgi:hypothetical protein